MPFSLKFFLTQALILIFLIPHQVSAQDRNIVWEFSSIISGQEPLNVIHSPQFSFSNLPVPQKTDNRINQLQSFLISRKSPLAPHSAHIVDLADKYGLDWKLLVAISGVESGFGRVMPQNSFNAYGWSNGLSRFESWENSIEHVSKFLGEKYIGQGLKTLDQIASRYCPGSDTWADNVKIYMKNIEDFIPKS